MRIRGKYRARRGLSLVEVITVIGLVLILTTIILSALFLIKNRAGVAKCAGNLRSYGNAIYLYAADHGGDLPSIFNPPDPEVVTHVVFWDLLLNGGYMGVDRPQTGERFSLDPWSCPTAETVHGIRHRFLYGLNYYRREKTNPFQPLNVANVDNPSDTLMMADSWNPNSSTQDGPSKFAYWVRAGNNVYQGRIDFRHQGRANVLYFDGSVRILDGPDNPPLDSETKRIFWSD